jgi:transposase
MVRRVRAGQSRRAVAREFGVDVSTVSYWVNRAAGQRLDRADFGSRKTGRAWNRTAVKVERKIVQLRSQLRTDALGEFGAEAIAQVLRTQVQACPGRATINRVLARHGLQDGARRWRRPAPPKGWYLPAVAAGHAEVDSFDFIEGLKIAGGPILDVLTAKSLHGALTDAWVVDGKSTRRTVPLLLQRWQRDGLPHYAQFDNDTVFQGAHQFPDAVGAVSRLCLQLGVVPVFVPALEHGMQNAIESFNALWQAKVWHRYRVANAAQLQAHSERYTAAHRARHAAKADCAPARVPVPARFCFRPTAPLSGTMIYIRRTNERGQIHMLGHTFAVSPAWRHRLVRCEVDFGAQMICCFALRRAAPSDQPMLAIIPYHRLDKPFEGTI